MRTLLLIVLVVSGPLLFGQNENRFLFKGSASVRGFHFYQNENARFSSVPSLGASFSLNARLGYGKFITPISVSLNNQGVDFQNPFNRYGISPSYKWIKVHLGWRSMRFTKFSMQNVQFFGAGIELTPGKLRMTAMKGKLDYRIPGLPLEYQESLPGRSAYAIKLGVGSRKRYVDLVFLKVNDEQDSRDSIYRPKENAVLGLDMHLPAFNNHITFDLDAGLSVLTENKNASGNLLDNVSFPRSIESIISPNNSTHINYAIEGGISFQFGRFRLSNTYRRVMPEYQSLGLNYLRNDQEAIITSPSISLWKGKLYLTSTIGLERNNLDFQRNQSQRRVISSANVNIRPSAAHNLNFQYANYSFDQRIAFDSLVTDTIVVQQINRNLGGSYTFTMTNSNKVRLLTITMNVQEAENLTQESLGNTTKSILANFSQSNIQSRMTYNLGVNYFDLEFSESISSQIGINGGVSYRGEKSQMRARLGGLISIDGKKNRNLYSQFSWQKNLTESFSLELSGRIRYFQRETKGDGLTLRSDVRLIWRW